MKNCPFCNQELIDNKCSTKINDNPHFRIVYNSNGHYEHLYLDETFFISWIKEEKRNIEIWNYKKDTLIYSSEKVSYDEFIKLCRKFKKMMSFL